MEKQLSEKLPRVEVVDALRGFAVMAILLVHSLEHFIFPVYPVDQPAWLNILNDGVFNVTFTLLAGKSYAIFALLFGFTFYIEGGNLAASKIRNLECPNYEICLIDYGCGKFNRKIHIMEQYP